ncbi:MAG: hypothetical protein HY330_02880, partial [Chloroflexi bacterium]|nr:hypothetical protein [Chloroflexota bacterium]
TERAPVVPPPPPDPAARPAVSSVLAAAVRRLDLLRAIWLAVLVAGVVALLAEGAVYLHARGRADAAAPPVEGARRLAARQAGAASALRPLEEQRTKLAAQLAWAEAALAVPAQDVAGLALDLARSSGIQVTSLAATPPAEQMTAGARYRVQRMTLAGQGSAEEWARFLRLAEAGSLGIFALEGSRLELRQGRYAGSATFSLYHRAQGLPLPAAPGADTAAPSLAWSEASWALTAALLERLLASAPGDRDARRLLVESYLQWGAILLQQGNPGGADERWAQARAAAQREPGLVRLVDSFAAVQGGRAP